MNDLERQVACLSFNECDRIPLETGWARKSTRDRWYGEGLREDIVPGGINEFAYREAGGRMSWPERGEGFPVNERMIPEFEEKIIEEKDNSRIVQDWKGNVCEIGKEFSPEYLRNAIDFVTRRWIKCPVESRADWAAMKRRYDARMPGRLPDEADALGKRLQSCDWFTEIHFSGPYWQLREWLGFEALSMMFYDDPAFVHEMIEFWREYVGELLHRALALHVPASVHISEDMAYKGFSMLSPEMVREFLLPTWKYWGEIIRGAGVPIYAMDSDGFIGELIPLWLEAGINACDPVEVAAGNDICEFRRKFGREMAYRGGVDKREMAKGGSFIEAEIERVRPVIEDGGFIPGCDHGIPADVAWPEFLHYVEILAKVTGWL